MRLESVLDNRTRQLSMALLLAAGLACGGGGGNSSVAYNPPPDPGPSNPWSVPVPIENVLLADARDPAVAVDSNGRSIVAWNGLSGSNSAIWANRYVPGSDWTGYGTIESLSGDAFAQKIAMNADGIASIVWEQDAGTSSIQSFRYIPGIGFDGQVDPVSVSGVDAKTPCVAVDAIGNAISAWIQSDGVRYHVVASRYTAIDGIWSAPLPLDTNTSEDAQMPSVAMDPDGNAVVVWHQSADLVTGVYSVWACNYWVSDGWSQALNIQLGTGDARNPAIAMSSTGARAVWSEKGPTDQNFRIYTSLYTLGSNLWDTPIPLSADAAYADAPSVGMSEYDDSIVAWAEAVSAQSYAVMALGYNGHDGWEMPGSFDYGTSNTGVPVVSMNSSGLGAVIWNRDDGHNLDLYAVRYNQGWEPSFLVSPDAGGEAYSPSIAVGSQGDIVAAWMQKDLASNLYHVYSSQRR